MPSLHVSTSPAVTAAVLSLYDCRSPRNDRSPLTVELSQVASSLNQVMPMSALSLRETLPTPDSAPPLRFQLVAGCPPNTPMQLFSARMPATPVSTPMSTVFASPLSSTLRSVPSPRTPFRASFSSLKSNDLPERELMQALKGLMTPLSADTPTASWPMSNMSTPLNTPVSAFAAEWQPNEVTMLEVLRRLQMQSSSRGNRSRTTSNVSTLSGRTLFEIAESDDDEIMSPLTQVAPPNSPAHGPIVITTVMPLDLHESLNRLRTDDQSMDTQCAAGNMRPSTRKLSPRADPTMPQNTPVSTHSSDSFYIESDEDMETDILSEMQRQHIQSVAEQIRLGLEKINQRKMEE